MIVEKESSLHKKCVLYLNTYFIFFALLCKIVCFEFTAVYVIGEMTKLDGVAAKSNLLPKTVSSRCFLAETF
jgi:hypothetical protein